MASYCLSRTLSLVLCVSALALTSAPAQEASGLVKVELLAEPAAIVPGEPFAVGVKLSMKEHWHTYWRNPGDSGEPTQVTWKLPRGFVAGDLQWPAPSLIRLGPVASFGYDGETILLARVTPPRDVRPGTTVDLAADIAYVVCEKICIPGEASVSLASGLGGAHVVADQCGVRCGTQQAAAAIALERNLQRRCKGNHAVPALGRPARRYHPLGDVLSA